MPWKKMLAMVSGEIKPLHKLEYVLEENRAYRALLERQGKRILLTDPERIALAEKAKPLGTLLAEVATIARPATLLKWHRNLVAKKWTFKYRNGAGRPKTNADLTELILKFAKENRSWGYDRIVGALKNLGHDVSDQTVGNILKKYGLGVSHERKRKSTWAEFIKQHKNVLWATDFFTTEIWTKAGLTTFYVLFFIQIKTRKIVLAGVTPNPKAEWVQQMARNVIGEIESSAARYLIHDRDTIFCKAFDEVFKAADIKPLLLSPQSPNLNAFAERWVRSIKSEVLDQMILFGEKSLRHVLKQYCEHYHEERNHQGLDNVISFPDQKIATNQGKIAKRERLGGLLNFYHRKAA